MELEMIKAANGVFVPAYERDLPRLAKFKNGELYTLEAKLTRNPSFHRKMFAFLNFCFQYWCADHAGYEFSDEATQFDEFRKNLTILAGFYDVVTTIRGEVRYRAKSLSYANMDQDEFERCYNAMINAALKHVFGRSNSPELNNRLLSFF